MRARPILAVGCLAALAGCGLENFLSNSGRIEKARPASKIRGSAAWAGSHPLQLSVTDGQGNAVTPFAVTVSNGGYEIQLPSSKYAMIEVHGRVGDTELRALVPFVGEESAVDGVDLDARNMAEALITEARLSADGTAFSQVTPSAYVGNGVDSGTRTLIRAAFGQAGPTKDLLDYVTNLIAKGDPLSGATSPFLFATPVLTAAFAVNTSPLDSGWLVRNQIDYTGDGNADGVATFNTALSQAAQLYRPAGCPDSTHLRVVFTVDFTDGCQDGVGNTLDRFKWVVNKPGKSMFFVGWIYTNDPPGASEVQDPAVNAMLGASIPNTVPMYDDGTNGDEVANDGIWTLVLDVPYDPAHKLRIGYKFTWGFRGAVWTGSEEWPGNSRMLEVVDVNGDSLVYRRDVFGDEATNKDKANLNPSSGGTLTWSEALHGCGPESHEQPFTPHKAGVCGGDPALGSSWFKPKAVGPITVACSQ